MILRALPFLAALALSACGVTLGQQGPLPGSSRTVAVPATPPDLRERARAFLAVIEEVEPVAEAECRARSPQRNCDLRIVVDDRPGMPPNAFQTVDDTGRPLIGFTLSLIATVANEDELAFILSHEASHHIAGHLELAALNAQIGADVFGRLAGGLNGGNPDAIRTAQEVGALIGARTYSQEFELEADALGTVIAARAGYDPVRGAEFFRRIPDPGNRFLGTHPPNEARIAVVLQTAAELGL
jgi:predicted Zn-dependent protease